MDSVEDKGFIPPDFVESETNWFYNELGIDDMYFQTESVDALVYPIAPIYLPFFFKVLKKKVWVGSNNLPSV